MHRTISLPIINENIEIPNVTPASKIIPTLSVPVVTETVTMDVPKVQNIPNTEKIK